MQISHNQTTIGGNLTDNPTTKKAGEATVTSFCIAQRERDGGHVNFIHCEAWNGTGTHIAQYHSKGDPILVQGRIRITKGKDKQHYTTMRVSEVTFIGQRKRKEG